MTDKETYRQISERLELKAQREAHTKEIVQAWRARNPHATCSDQVAVLLAMLEREFSRGRG